MQDRDLLDRFRRGEREALARVFEIYARRVSDWVSKGFAYSSEKSGPGRFSGFSSPADQNDVIHEIFRAAFEERARHSYSGLAPFEGYLFVISKNVIMKRLRAHQRQVALSDTVLDNIPSTAPPADELVQRAQAQQMVRDFLSTLDDSDREFVHLRFVEDLPQVDVGERLGWTRKKVRLREGYVRKTLTRFLLRARGRSEVGEIGHPIERTAE